MTDWTGNGANCVEMASGRFVDILNPDPATIVLDDIAHHLAQANRYNGACARPMSVAEHTLLVVDRLLRQGYGARVCLLGLHHDDPEAILGDVVRPLKPHLTDYKPIESNLDMVIWDALGLPFADLSDDDREAVERADDWACACEAWHLLPSKGKGWATDGLFDPDDPRNPGSIWRLMRGGGLAWDTAREMWLTRHHRLTAGFTS